MIKIYLTIALLSLGIPNFAQELFRIQHYSVDDGLSENHILSALQDKKGIMWFGTFNGLDMFDGYSFRNFIGDNKDKYQLLNYRIDRLQEDKQGFIWLQTNDLNIYRFNPSTEKFLQVPQCVEEFKDYTGGLNQITVLPDKSIWLYNSDEKLDGCFRVKYNDSLSTIAVSSFSSKNKDLLSDRIFQIYGDNEQNTWILNSKGINLLKNDETEIQALTDTLIKNEYYSVCEQEKYIFFGGDNGKLLEYNKNAHTYSEIQTSFDSKILNILGYNDNELIIISDTHEFYLYNYDKNDFLMQTLDIVRCKTIFGCSMDKYGLLWFDTDYYGAVYVDLSNNKTTYLPVTEKPYSIIAGQTSYIIENQSGNLWVKIRNGGLYRYDRKTDQLEPISKEDKNGETISNIIHSAFSDKQGNLWLSTYLQGFDIVVSQPHQFTFIKPAKDPEFILNNEIRSIYQDNESNIWVGSKEGYVYLYNDKKELKGMLCQDGSISYKNPLKIPVYNILQDHSGLIWLATKGSGIYTLKRNGPDQFEINNYRYDPDNPFSLTSNSVYNIFEDKLKRIWIGTFFGGINIIETFKGEIRFINSNNSLINYPIDYCPKVRCITEDSNGNIYIGTTNGLLISEMSEEKYQELTFERFIHDPKDSTSISGNDVQYILPLKNNDAYLSLSGGGVNIIKGGYYKDQETEFGKIEEMPPDITYTLLEDNNSNIWMSTQTRIIKYNVKDNDVELFKPRSTKSYFFSEAAACFTRKGEILYGTSDGLISFDPLKLNKSTYKPRIYLNNLQVVNKSIEIGNKDSILSKSLDEMENIVLSHKQNTFSISYSAIDYVNPDAIQYAYYLDGLEKDWNYIGEQRIARYINLPKGSYTFKVKSTNSDGVWVENERTIAIIRLPSFWESNWGSFLSIFIIAMIASIIGYIIFTIYRLRNEVTIEQRISDVKLRFFTDISHELRTPLTLIISPINNILKKEALSSNVKEQLQVVQKNTNRLLRLINQILDFRKIQSNKLKLFIEATNVEESIHEICKSFKEVSDEKSISVEISNNANNDLLWIDKDKFEKIFFNLISNAFKYNKSNRSICIEINEDSDHIIIDVTDRGIGMSNDKLKVLFNRFENFSSSLTSQQASTGIGLHLTKELIELQKGRIEVTSDPGKGSTFKVYFKKGYNHFDKDEEFVLHDLEQDSTKPALDETESTPHLPEQKVIPVVKETEDEITSIIIAEDNDELREFLEKSLGQNYNVRSAANGIDVLKLSSSSLPDLFIADLMMPELNGLELAKRLKNDLNTSHIPFILLTAKTDLESKIEAMEIGVDDYITKPFNLTYLEARIENLLKIRSELQAIYKSTLTSGTISLPKPVVTNLDEEFLQNLMKYLEENYQFPEMVIEDIANNVGVSRSSLFKKMKSITGLAPVEFVREFRLQRAVQIIEAGETNVSQVSFNVGINDTRYFSTCFKQRFGLTPSKYIAKESNRI